MRPPEATPAAASFLCHPGTRAMSAAMREPLRRTVRANGIRLSFLEMGDGPAVVLCHGFPELAYSWRRQLPALAAAGFHAIAPDQRGYGDSERPDAVAAYDIHHLTGDLVGLLDALHLAQAVFVGHDWGGIVAWHMPLLHRARTVGVVGVNTPYFPRPGAPPVGLMRAMWGDRYYIVHFQQPGVADAAFARDVRRVFTQLFRTAAGPVAPPGVRQPRTMVELVEGPEAPGRPLLADDELQVYVDAFSRTGFTGGLNWYRNLDRNWATTEALAGAMVTVPALMIAAERDPVLRPELSETMDALVPDLERVVLPGCGHWTQHEQPEALNRVLLDWLRRRGGVQG
jgi:pimeloyl-ACP methyl ester carboxylesterase